jgi:ethanolamine utilization protein EutN
MKIGRVIGNVVSTRKDEGLDGKKLLWVQPITPDNKDTGKPVLALDSVGAGYKETVLYVTAKEASFPFLPEGVPSDCTIVGIIDSVDFVREKE